METLIRDIRYACRGFLAQPAWTAAALICLSIATGANTSAFSAVNAVALRPLPFERADQIVMIALNEGGGRARPVFLQEYRELAARSAATFDSLATWTFQPFALATEQGGRMVQAQLVSGNYFQMLRVAPGAGQLFGPDADREGVPTQAVFSDRLWRQIYGGEPFTPGRVARIDGRAIQVVGVAPRNFVGAMGLILSDLWVPAAAYPQLVRTSERVPAFGLVGRRRNGVTNDQARAQLDVIAADLSRQRGAPTAATTLVETASGFGVPPGLKGPLTSASGVVFGLIALLVAVAAANVASLILARATGRDREVGVRLAMGATPWRIARQLLTEGLVLTIAGSIGGMLMAAATTRLANRFGTAFSYISYGIDFRPDFRVFVYAVAATVGLALLCGLVPARIASRRNLVDVLKRSPSGGARAPLRSLSTLVAGQIAVSTMLLVVAGLLARTYLNTQGIERGFDTRNLVLATLDLDQVRLGPAEGRRAYEDLARRIAALPGIDHAGLASEPIIAPPAVNVAIRPDTGAASIQAASVAVTPEYFETVGLRPTQGRLLQPLDMGTYRVAVVNETLARRIWPAGSPIGRRFHVGTRDDEPIEVVGVVRDVASRALTAESRAMFYEPFAQRYASQMTVLVRSSREPSALIEAITQEIRRTHRDLAVLDIQTAESRLATATAARRVAAQILGVVSLLGLILTGVGLFGVLSYAARRRLREFGIRIALGAGRRDVRVMIAKHGLLMVIPGVVFGIAGSLALARTIAGALYGVGAADPATLAGVSVMLAAVTALALYLPARWATRVNPVAILRED